MPLVEVYKYAEQVSAKGLVVMDTPGLDPVRSPEGRGRRQRVCFTPGAARCTAASQRRRSRWPPTAMYEHMNDDMDVNCGAIFNGRR